MFNEMTIEEQYEVEGGGIGLIVKGAAVVVALIWIAGTVKGCTDEAAK